MLNDIASKSKDHSYRQFIRHSNAKCNYIKPLICCPSDGRQNQLVESSIQGRLLTPAEGCGFSNQNLRVKFAGKKRSKLGEIHSFFLILLRLLKGIVIHACVFIGAFPWLALIGYNNNFGQISWECGKSSIEILHPAT